MTRFDVMTLAAVGIAAVLAAAASFALVAAVASPAAEPTLAADPWATAAEASPAAAEGDLVVDVEGGVVAPGIHRLPAGSRVADALVAAGGYAESADLAVAARSLNLAAALVDGQQIYVPVVGETSSGGDAGGDGLVNLNRASQSELEALPGIGPVTAEKIIAARAEQPFATLDELVTREVLTARQLEQIADLVTVP
ncbi:MAG: helix-hairpin-helix domain-containing protein [Candidatus Limnocylindria bacterium]